MKLKEILKITLKSIYDVLNYILAITGFFIMATGTLIIAIGGIVAFLLDLKSLDIKGMLKDIKGRSNGT